jgi:hypothetical protein
MRLAQNAGLCAAGDSMDLLAFGSAIGAADERRVAISHRFERAKAAAVTGRSSGAWL